MKIIERPTSKSYVPEFPFHYLKDEAEAENIRKLAGDKRIVPVMRTIDKDTFQPLFFFAIEEVDKPFSEWLKYVSPMVVTEHTVNMKESMAFK